MTDTRRLLRCAAPLWIAALLLAAAPARAQHEGHGAGAAPTTGLRAELLADVEQLEQKYVGLAEAMAGKYGYRPGEGVRSASEVFMHVAGSTFMIPTMLGVQPPEAYRGASMQESMTKLRALEQVTEPQQVVEALKQAFAHARHAIAATPDDQLDAPTKLFGRDATKRRVMTLLVTHLHEHLGQSIAYARASGVTPPWSAGE